MAAFHDGKYGTDFFTQTVKPDVVRVKGPVNGASVNYGGSMSGFHQA